MHLCCVRSSHTTLRHATFRLSLASFIRRLSLPSASPNSWCKKSEYDIESEPDWASSWLGFSWGAAGCCCLPDIDEFLLQGGSGEGGRCLLKGLGRGGRKQGVL